MIQFLQNFFWYTSWLEIIVKEDAKKEVTIEKEGFKKKTYIKFKKYNSLEEKIKAQIEFLDYSKPIFINDKWISNEISKNWKNQKIIAKNKDFLFLNLWNLFNSEQSNSIKIPIVKI